MDEQTQIRAGCRPRCDRRCRSACSGERRGITVQKAFRVGEVLLRGACMRRYDGRQGGPAAMDATIEPLGSWGADSMRVQAWIGEEMLYLRLTGGVTLQNCFQAMAYVAGLSEGRDFATTLVDFRGAVVLAGGEVLNRNGVTAKSDLAQKWRPAAYLVSPVDRELFERLAWNMAGEGFERTVFTDAEVACAWIRKRAAKVRARGVGLQAPRKIPAMRLATSLLGELDSGQPPAPANP